MTVQELIDALERCQHKDSLVVHYNAELGISIELYAVIEDNPNIVFIN